MPLPKPNRTQPAIKQARAARTSPSAAECLVWKYLRNSHLGFKFRREYPVLEFRLDFYCAEARLAVELDGEQHDPKRDAMRDARLAELGIEVLRIPNREFFMLDDGPPPEVYNRIRIRCEERTGRAGVPFEP